MTDYNPIPDNVLEPDDPIPADLGVRWRDNPIAMFEGAAGAPGLWNRALAKPLAGTTARLTGPAATAISVTNAIPANTITLGSCTVLGFGTVRISVVARRTGGSNGSVAIGRVRAGVLTTLATLSLTGSDQTLTVDASFTPMDVLSVIGVSDASGSGSTQITSTGLNVGTSGDDFWVCNIAGQLLSSLTNTVP